MMSIWRNAKLQNQKCETMGFLPVSSSSKSGPKTAYLRGEHGAVSTVRRSPRGEDGAMCVEETVELRSDLGEGVVADEQGAGDLDRVVVGGGRGAGLSHRGSEGRAVGLSCKGSGR